MKYKLNIAVIGCSVMGKLHMQGVINHEKANLYAICDKYEDTLKAAMEEKNVKIGVTDWHELVNDENIDAVVIVTPDRLHPEMTEAFLRAGKDVLCEKPMALNLELCEEMMRVEKETGRKLMIGQVCRCTPGFIAAKELVDSGKIGELFFVESEYAHNYDHAKGVDNWRMTPDRNGFIGGGCHAVDLLRWIAGNPTEVTAYSNHKCNLDWPTDDCTVAIYKFPNNVIGKVFSSIGCRRSYTMRSVFYGTRGTVICDNTSPSITLFSRDVALSDGSYDFTKPIDVPVEVNNHNVNAEIDVFINALINGEDMPVTSMEGASTIAVACATVESATVGKTVSIKYPTV